jgi:hypothetical protein
MAIQPERRLGAAAGIHYLIVNRIEHRKCVRAEYGILEKLASELGISIV